MGAIASNLAKIIERDFGIPYDLIGFVVGLIAFGFLIYYYFFRK